MLPPASFRFAPCDPARAAELRAELGCTETLAWVLARRGVTVEEARRLVADDPAADEAALHDPMLLGDMAAAVERIRYAIETGETIAVHGDYDADGVCSTTLLVEGLEAIGATDVRAFLPDRFTNGYGLQIEQVERFARDGVRLVIAVDCGITAVEAVAHARDLGLDVIVCDHHRPGDVLPDAILCSTRPSDYPFPELCATAVAGKLVVALGGPSGPRQHELEAIATVADCMPLVDENRALVRRGLRALRTTDRPGLVALANQSGLRLRDIDAEAIAFKLAPRINAIGRVSQSERAYELLRAPAELAPALAVEVDETNTERRSIEREIVEQAIAQVEGWSEAERAARIYVVHGRGWHEGVVGIVASRIVERYWRPVIVIADGEPARGSGRSIDGVDLHAALASCDDLLLRWGGHAQAGGLSIDPANLPALRERLAAWGRVNISDDQLQPSDTIDAVVMGTDLRFELVQELERLAPFGTGWERPRLLAVGAHVEETRAVGGDGSHLKCVVRLGEQRVPGIGFGMAAHIPALAGVSVDVALRPSINRFRGSESLQVELDRIYAVPTERPTVLGWCAVQCTTECSDRVALDQLLATATGLVPSALADADPAAPPALEPILARADVRDLRHQNLGVEYVAQLLAAGSTVAVVVADVARRRDLLAPLAHADRFAVGGAALASERCAPLGLRARLHRLSDAPGARLVVVDHHALQHVVTPDAPLTFDAVVVLDPPATDEQRDLLAAAPAPVHVAFGAAEQRFTADSLAAARNVRGTLADAYRAVRDTGPLGGSELETVLLGAGPVLHPPSALTYGLRSLLDKGIVTLDSSGRLGLATETASSTS